MRKPILQAIFFDFDGVIVDSMAIKTEAFRTLFEDYDPEIIEKVVAYHLQHGGISRVEKIRYAHQHILKKPLTEEEVAHWAAGYADLVIKKVLRVDWIAGIKEFLENPKTMLPIFVISGTPEKELLYIIEQRGIVSYFQEILGSPIKKPKHISNLLAKYQLNPEQCLFVGDAMTDYSAAKETGIQFIGIQGEITFPGGTLVLPDCVGLREAIEELFTY